MSDISSEKATQQIDTCSTSGFEEALEKLENIVKRMEQGDLTLEESLSEFEEGIKLTKSCQQALTQAELKVQQLTQDQTGVNLQDFTEQSQ